MIYTKYELINSIVIGSQDAPDQLYGSDHAYAKYRRTGESGLWGPHTFSE